MAIHWASAREDHDTGDVFRELTAKIDPLIAVEKSPSYTLSTNRLVRIYQTFPNARFIHLIRHPIPQCNSVMKLSDGLFALFVNAIDFKSDQAILDPQIAWHDINVNILNFLDMVPQEQQMRLKGEELMAHPRKHFKSLCRWLGVRDDEEAIEEMMHPERSPFACFGPISALYGNDPNFLRRPSFRQHTPQTPPLTSTLQWRDDGEGLRPEVIRMAQGFGYR